MVERHDIPSSCVGAPLPHLICDEHRLLLAYLVSEPDPTWDGSYAKLVGPTSDGLVAVVRFERPYAHITPAWM
ncbi:MAG: hypothetical protein ACRC1K_00115 [Planctomycetia bacterium]